MRTTILFRSSRLGDGNPRCSELLMDSFLASLENRLEEIEEIILINAAVVLATDDSPHNKALQELEKNGIPVFVSQESLNFYNYSAKQNIGEAVVMDEITDKLFQADTILTL